MDAPAGRRPARNQHRRGSAAVPGSAARQPHHDALVVVRSVGDARRARRRDAPHERGRHRRLRGRDRLPAGGGRPGARVPELSLLVGGVSRSHCLHVAPSARARPADGPDHRQRLVVRRPLHHAGAGREPPAIGTPRDLARRDQHRASRSVRARSSRRGLRRARLGAGSRSRVLSRRWTFPSAARSRCPRGRVRGSSCSTSPGRPARP